MKIILQNLTHKSLIATILWLCVFVFGLSTLGCPSAFAGINDDRYDGNIFPLYAGNGSLVPPRTNLALALQAKRPSVLMFYVDDSSDCKQNAIVMSQIQAFYTQNVSLIPVSVDTLFPLRKRYSPRQEAYYYNGRYVPQWIVIDRKGTVAFDKVGQASYQEVDDVLRKLFDLPPRPDDFSLGNPADFSPSPSADSTFWTAPARTIESGE